MASRRPVAVFLLLGFLYLAVSYDPRHYWDEYFYLYSAGHHDPVELFRWDPVLTLFPPGFFSAKAGFVYLVYGLAGATGHGQSALVFIQGLFALLALGAAVAAFGVSRELLPPAQAARTAIVFLFLPLTLYFGFKVLSEVPGGLLATTASWAFLRSFRAATRAQLWCLLGMASLTLSVAVFCRFTSILLFAGLVWGLLIVEASRYPRVRVILRAGIVGVTSVAAVLLAYAAVGINLLEIGGLATNLLRRPEGTAIKLFAAAMTVQGFALFFLWALKPPYSRQAALAIVWAGVCTLPFVVSEYVEPRFFYMAPLPLAILIEPSLWRFAERLQPKRTEAAWVGLLAAIVAGNQLLASPMMPHELDQNQYATAVHELREHHPDAALITPWVTDYCFLRFAFPAQPVKLSFSEMPAESAPFHTEAFQQWVGEGQYLGSPEALEEISCPSTYIGWTFNPAVIEIEKRLGWLGVFKGAIDRDRLKNHLAQSWMWEHPSITMQPIVQRGDYQGFEVRWGEEPCR